MNLHKGFRRAFVVLWVLYGASVVLYLFYPVPRYGFTQATGIYAFTITRWENLWTNFGWHLLWAVPVVLLVPPLIVYGIIRLLLKIGWWVARGFRESPR
jgi:hypothetical protein